MDAWIFFRLWYIICKNKKEAYIPMKKRQVYNPFLPLHEYIPDGEPHVFGDRVYLYGSHDKEGGYTFCMEDYVVYSAPVSDLSDWRCEGVTYRAEQDPMYKTYRYMYAPDVVQGNDGRYYLYYCMAGDYGIGGYRNPISVAVCDTPAGKYSFLGHVRNKDGSLMMRYVCFDPAVMNDNGTIRLYYGTQYGIDEKDFLTDENIASAMDMFGRTREEVLSYPDNINGPIGLTLEDDMLTVKDEPHHIIPYNVRGTDFEAHPFFEGSSMRRVGDKYYFVYSSWQNHELCYAVSDYPDRDFRFGGTIVSNGDVGYNGRAHKNSLNMTGTTHGSIVNINDEWYVFYHRLTHKSDYSRQACAERIHILPDGSIPQVSITSCGLNGGALSGEGVYPAVIACNLTNGHMPHGCNCIYDAKFPNVTNLGDDRFIGEIENGTLIGYKYFNFEKKTRLCVTARFETPENRPSYEGPIRVDERGLLSEGENSSGYGECSTGEPYLSLKLDMDAEEIARIPLDRKAGHAYTWQTFTADRTIPEGTHALYFIYHSSDALEKLQLKELVLLPEA